MTTKFDAGDTVLVEGIVETVYVKLTESGSVKTEDNEPLYKIRIKSRAANGVYRIRVNEDVVKSSSEEQRQGEWVYKEFDEETGISNSYFCSKCGYPQGQVYISFCGNCGSDMRKDRAE